VWPLRSADRPVETPVSFSRRGAAIMSYTSQKNRPNRMTMAAAIMLNGSVIIAVMLSPMVAEFIPDPGIMIGENIPIKEPPPLDKKIEKTIEAKKLDPIFVPKPIFNTHSDPETQITAGDKPTGETVIALNGNGEDFRSVIKPVDPPIPIFKAAVRDPRFAKSFQPDFPVGLLQREIEGTVKVRVLIGADGRVRQVVILDATDPDFAKATQRKALSSWRFTPATRGGEPVEDWQVLTVKFNIN
jgi:periplasmic protein TonB